MATVGDKAVSGAKVTDAAIPEHPDKFIAVAVEIEMFMGYLPGRQDKIN